MDPQLYEAARSGDLVLLERIEGNATLLSQVTPKKNTILHVSAEFKQREFFKEATCLSPRALFNSANSKGDTVLHVAARAGCSDVVSFIIEHSKVLHADIENGQVEGCKELLRLVNMDGDNALHCAVRNGHFEVAKALIEADPELSICVNGAEESPLYIAAAKEFADIADLILSTSSSSLHGGTNGMTALHAALYYQLNGTMKKFVKKRPHMIKEGDILGWTPLHYAAHFGNVNAVTLFLRKDSSAAYLQGKDGESALHIAAFRGRIPVMRELLRTRPDCCDLLENKGRTALHAAVLGGQENSVRYILGDAQLVGLVNEADQDGNTPLHLAALHRKYSIIAILARHPRVDIKATNKKNLTALGIYSKYQETGFAAAKVYYMLKETYGIHDMQAWVNAPMKRTLDKEIGEPHEPKSPNAPRTRENFYHPVAGKGNMLEIHLLVAVLIATVTFAAAFTLPGGYQNDRPDEGMAVLSSKIAFKAFVIFDTMAFCCSVAAVYLQFGTSGGGYYERARFVNVAMVFIFIAILAMVLAFASGMYVVLAKSVGLGLTAFIMVGCFILTFCLRWFVDPLGNPDLGLRPLRKSVRNFLFRHGIM
ncbi:protein ACCELERATED CELL DEATH 6-like [Punica granatum]|uniref:PGG domain-containing protein n=2 Tax=Punica granatum TaxID=22663 RepID=A0A218WG75_PUNGR|nr:protein ACCELERATED CELL DEATH 6-like [Punica granatum]OWM71686.1 hypothetical protein CDL15_Pgr005874 [Punica granatum]PKI59671.1 hypothetical protein CRG98_019933 [Punica granatum]